MDTKLIIMIYVGMAMPWLGLGFAAFAPNISGYRLSYYIGYSLAPKFISDFSIMLKLYFDIGNNRDISSGLWMAFAMPLLTAVLVYFYLRRLIRRASSVSPPSRNENIVYFLCLLIIVYPATLSMLTNVPKLYNQGDIMTTSLMLYWSLFWIVIIVFAALHWWRSGRLAPSQAAGAWEKLRSFSLGFAGFMVLFYFGLYLAPFVFMLFSEIPGDATFLLRFTRGVGLQWSAWLIWVPLILLEITRWFPYNSEDIEIKETTRTEAG